MKEYIKNALKYRVLLYSAFNYLEKILYNIPNRSIAKMQMNLIYYKVKNKISKKYDFNCYDYRDNLGKEKIVWIYWHQGINKAPELVKRCVNSIKKNISNNWTINILDYNMLKNYITFNNEIIELLETNKMSLQHFSDLIRLKLLYEYGGIWIDSTCFLINEIPTQLLNADLFFFSSGLKGDVPIWQNWFIISNKKNPYLKKALDIFQSELIKNKGDIHYFYSFFIMQVIIEKKRKLF